ncbi:MAG: hypothetical protein LBK18_05620 [Prevotellaceae bacterium]|nr:hypothetical protein [Prevotellaceae bacterium]
MSVSAAFGQNKEKVAVYVTGTAVGSFSDVLIACLKDAFTKSLKYAVVERTDEFLQLLQREHSYQQSGNVDDRLLAVLGKQFGVRYVCVAKLIELGGLGERKFLSVSLVDVETAEIVTTTQATISGADISSFMRTAQQVAREIAGKTTEEELAAKQQEAKKQMERIAMRKASREKVWRIAEYWTGFAIAIGGFVTLIDGVSSDNMLEAISGPVMWGVGGYMLYNALVNMDVSYGKYMSFNVPVSNSHYATIRPVPIVSDRHTGIGLSIRF